MKLSKCLECQIFISLPVKLFDGQTCLQNVLNSATNLAEIPVLVIYQNKVGGN